MKFFVDQVLDDLIDEFCVRTITKEAYVRNIDSDIYIVYYDNRTEYLYQVKDLYELFRFFEPKIWFDCTFQCTIFLYQIRNQASQPCPFSDNATVYKLICHSNQLFPYIQRFIENIPFFDFVCGYAILQMNITHIMDLVFQHLEDKKDCASFCQTSKTFYSIAHIGYNYKRMYSSAIQKLYQLYNPIFKSMLNTSGKNKVFSFLVGNRKEIAKMFHVKMKGLFDQIQHFNDKNEFQIQIYNEDAKWDELEKDIYPLIQFTIENCSLESHLFVYSKPRSALKPFRTNGIFDLSYHQQKEYMIVKLEVEVQYNYSFSFKELFECIKKIDGETPIESFNAILKSKLQ
jgi:hypothetical protein